MLHVACRMTVVVSTVLFLSAGCRQAAREPDSFDDGHAWIMPRPPAEIRIRAVDTQDESVENVTLWVYRDSQKVDDARFLIYDANRGLGGNSRGDIVLKVLGDDGGAYEVLLSSLDDMPRDNLVVEAPGYQSQSVKLDSLLFNNSLQTGTTSLTLDDETVELVVIEYTFILKPE